MRRPACPLYRNLAISLCIAARRRTNQRCVLPATPPGCAGVVERGSYATQSHTLLAVISAALARRPRSRACHCRTFPAGHHAHQGRKVQEIESVHLNMPLNAPERAPLTCHIRQLPLPAPAGCADQRPLLVDSPRSVGRNSIIESRQASAGHGAHRILDLIHRRTRQPPALCTAECGKHLRRATISDDQLASGPISSSCATSQPSWTSPASHRPPHV